MIIIELTYKKSLDVVNQFVDEHRDFLQSFYDQGLFLASGPKEPRDGGIIIAVMDKATASNLIKQDPFYREAIAEYRIIEFLPKKYHHCIELLLQ